MQNTLQVTNIINEIVSIVGQLNSTALIITLITGFSLTRGDFILSRILRIGATLILVAYASKSMNTGNAVGITASGNIGVLAPETYVVEGFKGLVILLPIGLIWINKIVGNISESLTDGFYYDTRPAKANNINKNLDKLAKLANSGQKSKAIKLAKNLQRTGGYSHLAMDTLIYRLNH